MQFYLQFLPFGLSFYVPILCFGLKFSFVSQPDRNSECLWNRWCSSRNAECFRSWKQRGILQYDTFHHILIFLFYNIFGKCFWYSFLFTSIWQPYMPMLKNIWFIFFLRMMISKILQLKSLTYLLIHTFLSDLILKTRVPSCSCTGLLINILILQFVQWLFNTKLV